MKYSLLSPLLSPKDRGAIWHILLTTGKTVCGRGEVRNAPRCGDRPFRVCKLCDDGKSEPANQELLA